MKKIRFGIAGTGNIAHRFANAIGNVKNAAPAAVASRTAAGAEAFGREFGIPLRFGSYEEKFQQLLAEIKETYQRKPAFLSELEKVEA